MALSEEQQAAIERIRENAGLTDNLTDQSARALLRWAEEQIEAGAASQDVVAAMRAANNADAEDSAGVLAAATAALPGRSGAASPPKEAALDAAPPARQPEASDAPKRSQDPEQEAQSRAETATALAAWRQRRAAKPAASPPPAAPGSSAQSSDPPAPADGAAAPESRQSRLSFWSRLRRGFGSRRKRR